MRFLGEPILSGKKKTNPTRETNERRLKCNGSFASPRQEGLPHSRHSLPLASYSSPVVEEDGGGEEFHQGVNHTILGLCCPPSDSTPTFLQKRSLIRPTSRC